MVKKWFAYLGCLVILVVYSSFGQGNSQISVASETIYQTSCPDPKVFVRTIESPTVEELTANDGEVDVVQDTDLRFDCDIRDWLEEVARYVTRESTSDLDVAVSWTTWLQETIGHSCLTPKDEHGQTVLNPVYLLKNRKMHCGQTARLVVDGLSTLEIPARVFQMKGHVSSEFYVDGRWILAEADILSHGQFLKNRLGDFVGIDEVKLDPSILRSVEPYLEENCWNLLSPDKAMKLMKAHNLSIGVDVGEGDSSVWIETFGQAIYGDSLRGSWITPYVIKKTATPEQESDSQYFGWNYYEFCSRENAGCTN